MTAAPGSEPRDYELDDRAARRRQGFVDVSIALLYAAFFLGYTVALIGPKIVFQPGMPLPLSTADGFVFDFRIELASRLSLVLMLASATALAIRRIRPRTSFLGICSVSLAQVVLGEAFSFWNVAILISLFSAAAYTSRAFGWLALFVVSTGYFGVWALTTGLVDRLTSLPDPFDVLTSARGATFVGILGLLVLIWAIGDQVRASRERVVIERERALRLEREHDSRVKLGTLAERHRIARELHDVVAHGLSVIVVQADGALYAAAEHPEAPREALAAISSTGRASLAEMRQLLGVLRDGETPAELAPQPELGSLPDLVERFRAAGLTIDFALDGPARQAPPAVALTVYRVVQESLTNVLKHAGRVAVRLRISFDPDAIRIEATNEPGARRTAVPDAPPGLGLIGMRERVALLGGTVSAGPTEADGFAVRAEIPRAPAIGRASFPA